ncbi:manganese/iron transport system substrate-binding protein [Krasilnikovia cinnamomea]|uniref:Manganese/iron transport system substrate-binding protein n=1 Tax=Krasilnikovia cinnamomea TaxID=349313 RepID=A0A4Q7ZSN9_9ACTN|nr:metal ABC transporter substrate-binding protein [Krasilnikovia cinnamomea]RZU53653.1 manganese/iron transport system substrate-binding protein [Krasilnikovia cinnamomea]
MSRSSIGARLLGGVLALSLLPTAGCAAVSAADGTGRLVIAVTVAPLTSIVSAVVGDRGRVEGIVPEGTNSHTFEPAPSVAKLLSQADVVFLNGLGLEEPTARLAEKNRKPAAKIVELGTGVLPEDQWIFDSSFPKEDGKPNPHLWTDPTYVIRYARFIADTLGARSPADATYFRSNADRFVASVDRLIVALRTDQETVPVDRRRLLTYHDAYAYFGRSFQWTIVGAVQPRDFSDPTPRELADLIDQIRAARVPTIFGSEVFPSKVLAEIGRATGARYEDTLRDDDLPGSPGQPEHSWLGLMRYNLGTMIRGLGGTATNVDAVATAQTDVVDEAVYPQ